MLGSDEWTKYSNFRTLDINFGFACISHGTGKIQTTLIMNLQVVMSFCKTKNSDEKEVVH